ncbi:uncharacterized protein [Palaemon carinicauda]|uniref:uncharacterized protein isoform X2 n=1 Tax=Palaemon carinicauda TaxID=392227 RepID=UPI0035B6600A
MEEQDKSLFWLLASETLVFIAMVLNFWIIIMSSTMISSMDSPQNETYPFEAKNTDGICRLMIHILASLQTLGGPTYALCLYIIDFMAILSFILGLCYALFLFWVYSKGRIPRQENALVYPHKRRVFKFSLIIFTLMILLDLFGVMTSGLLLFNATQQEDGIGSMLGEFLRTEDYSVEEVKGNIMPLYITGLVLNILIVLTIFILPVGLYTEMISSKHDEEQNQPHHELVPYVYDPLNLQNRYRI